MRVSHYYRYGKAEVLKAAKTATDADVFFTKQLYGYDIEQVDNYIHDITEAYQTTFSDYTALYTMYNELIESYKKLHQQLEHTKLHDDVVTRVLRRAADREEMMTPKT